MIVFILSLIFWACAGKKLQSNSSQKSIEGIWLEKWIGAGTDINYVDTLKIQKKGNKIMMSCINDPDLSYDSIFLNKEEFRFKMINRSDPKVDFFVHYKLKWQNNYEYLQGTISNINNQEDTVRLERFVAH